MNRFLKFTTQDEPALTASFLAAVLLAFVSKFVNLTDDDLTWIGPVFLLGAGALIRAGVFSPTSVRNLLDRKPPPPADAVVPPLVEDPPK